MPDVEGRETLAKLWAVIFDRTEPIHAGGFVNQGDEQTAVALQGLELHRIANALEDIAAHLAMPRVVIIDPHEMDGPLWGDR